MSKIYIVVANTVPPTNPLYWTGECVSPSWSPAVTQAYTSKEKILVGEIPLPEGYTEIHCVSLLAEDRLEKAVPVSPVYANTLSRILAFFNGKDIHAFNGITSRVVILHCTRPCETDMFLVWDEYWPTVSGHESQPLRSIYYSDPAGEGVLLKFDPALHAFKADLEAVDQIKSRWPAGDYDMFGVRIKVWAAGSKPQWADND